MGSGWITGKPRMLADDEFDMSAVQLGLPGCGDDILAQAPSGTFNIGYTPGPYDPRVIEVSQYSSDPQNQDVGSISKTCSWRTTDIRPPTNACWASIGFFLDTFAHIMDSI
ncbi:hypothetical protein JVT61DRAFT_12122 [Boletus reticuloceps]|uniref:Uncharacterized protein n=1 Tax=Boletus reticuloceps TaxID=495285 RepID=A0A8I3A4G0_9AGAM|nr:hypothetical protein JVT61DRAFT_12122 [Boletus reticuloceps]